MAASGAGGRPRVLVVNAGSSSLKVSLVDGSGRVLDSRATEVLELEGLGDVDAVGHRIVHGGERFTSAVLVDAGVREQLEALVELAPLHQPKALDALDAVSAALGSVPAIACFDTAFHATMPAEARTYALPREWRERFGLRRYGFHGLSHAWVARRAAEILARPSEGLRIVSCHLGAGASVCAIAGGRSLDTTMGFTPLEGLVMATRSGSVDPGVLLHLLEHGVGAAELSRRLEHDSGLLALAGTADMRELIERAAGNEEAAGLALDVYLHRLGAAIAAMAAALGGLDALAFTGGVGERAPVVRAGAADRLGFLGVAVDAAANGAAHADADVSAAGAPVATLVVTAREELEIARQVRELLAAR